MPETEPGRVVRRPFSRRTVLTGAGLFAGVGATTGVLVEQELLPGRSWVHRKLGLDGTDGRVPEVRGGRVVRGSLVSEARLGRRCGWALALPPGHTRDLPVAVVLHGRGNDHASVFDHDYLALDLFLAEAMDRGVPPFALASIDGDEAYWHARTSGDDPAAMVTGEFLPLLASRGVDTSRIGLLGWSMGGYGALHIARLMGPGAVTAVGAMSPALWHEYAETAPGAFDDETDFAEATAFGHQDDLAGIRLRIDCGEGDPFYGATRDYVEGFDPPPAGGFQPGDHDIGYWRRMAPAQLAFVGSALG